MKLGIKSRKNALLLSAAAVLLILLLLLPNFSVILSSRKRIFTADEVGTSENTDCIVVMGAGIRDGKPTPMLKDRLLTAIALYKGGAAPKIIMSGDHGREDYDEVGVMKAFAVEKGIPSEDVFTDHAGFSTYDTVYRAKEIFEADNIIIVSQKYHLYRALYISERLGVSAKGVSADLNKYRGQTKREVREILARDKDFFKCLIKPEPVYLGEKIPVLGDGNITDG